MKTGIILATLALGGISDCDWTTNDGGSPGNEVCEAEVRTNLGGQTIDTGTVSVVNDADNLYVVITGQNGWKVDAWHIYVGTGPVPVNRSGNPAPGQFPYAGNPTWDESQVVVTIPLSDLDATCGGNLTVAVHSDMVKWSGWSKRSETAWAAWDTDFTGSRWGGSFAYQLCCSDTPPPPPPPEECVNYVYHWRNHPELWPTSSMQLGLETYDQNELVGLLEGNPDTDVSVALAQQVITGRLNLAMGVAVLADVLTAMDDANDWFATYASLDFDGDGRLPYGFASTTTAEGALAYALKVKLWDFNVGRTGIPNCEDIQ